MDKNEGLYQFNNIMMHALDGIALIDAGGNYISLNMAYANICGYDMNELVGRHWTITVHPECHKNVEDAVTQMLQEGKTEREIKGVKENGDIYYKRLVIVSCYNEDMVLQGYYHFIQDITQRVLEEIELRRSQSLFESFMENSPAVAFMKNEKGKYIYINKRFAEFVRESADEVIGKNDYDLFPESVASELVKHDEMVIRSNAPVELFEEIPDIANDLISWLVFKFPFKCYNGETCIAGLAIRNPVQELNDFKDTLGLEMQKFTITAINSFISGITHETRSPVQAIDNAADLLIGNIQGVISLDDEKKMEFLRAIKQSANSIEAIVGNIMSFGSIKGYNTEEDIIKAIIGDTKEVDLATLIQETIKTYCLSSDYKENQIKIIYEGPESIKATVANNILRQVLINLLSNARKAISSFKDKAYSREEGRILVDVLITEDYYLIQVKDNGRGIPFNLQYRLFNPFFRPFREVSGTGLGLYLSKVFASNAKMKLSLEHSEPGNTIFSVKISRG